MNLTLLNDWPIAEAEVESICRPYIGNGSLSKAGNIKPSSVLATGWVRKATQRPESGGAAIASPSLARFLGGNGVPYRALGDRTPRPNSHAACLLRARSCVQCSGNPEHARANSGIRSHTVSAATEAYLARSSVSTSTSRAL